VKYNAKMFKMYHHPYVLLSLPSTYYSVSITFTFSRIQSRYLQKPKLRRRRLFRGGHHSPGKLRMEYPYTRPIGSDLAEAVNRRGHHAGTFSPYAMPAMLCHSLRTLFDDRFQRMLKRGEYPVPCAVQSFHVGRILIGRLSCICND
jgi:hypothetical protein